MKKILSIDDSKMVHMVIRKTLKDYPVEVLTAVDGQDGLRVAAESSPDLIILDATMPVMDGIEALRSMRETPGIRDIPVVMLSADASRENMDQAKELGARTFISKPFTGEKLLEGIRPYIDLSNQPA